MRDFELIELGPGTGRLLTDLLPTVQKLRASPASLTLFEASSELRQVQSKALATLSNAPKPRWASTLSEALDNPNEQPVIIIAHEFFDALPVHVLHKVPSKTGTESQWREQLVDIVEDPNPGEPQFRFVLSRAATPAVALAQSVCTIQPQTDSKVLEVCADGMSTARRLAELIHRRGGAALIIDYGSDTLRGNTVRALSKHAITDVLASPGESDITADVNFGHLRHAVSGVPSMRLWSSISQREFLLRLGAAERFRMIARSVVATDESDEEIDNRLLRLQQDYDRIVGVGEQNMGTVYKVAVIANEKEGVPFGFANRSG
ncbi:Protein arginine methyltransferase NDUFAF7, mitochondrial [Gracilariopsis chorda]|uniref:Protein arginine methyltransferase NDUFAF7 n=1 Tax=Gracilariopsis chorda TaxID=448386 RepID=A0A2V3IM55_9FLOR|nr:Protein arginine methyltransferase NDUFAF7, mitochondrial [Gracilariopsis chorda]|eukprot:PXF43164.1 Protein arginine methyltransferase NDUFAF7, mitochondrial [Gracilariopsis chorda]